jgi:hypothetical protein
LILAVVEGATHARPPHRRRNRCVTRRSIDAAAYERRSREGPCFVLLGHTLVAPRTHREQVTGDFGIEEYRHVHWHVAPLPPGVPYEQQQFGAFSFDRGVLALPDEEMAALARRISARVEAMQRPSDRASATAPSGVALGPRPTTG